MSSDAEYLSKHAEMRMRSAAEIQSSFLEGHRRGIRTEDMVIALTHIDEAIVPEDSKEEMRSKGVKFGCLVVDRHSFSDAIRDFVHPDTGAQCYEKLTEAMASQMPGHFYVVVMADKHSSLTRVKVQ